MKIELEKKKKISALYAVDRSCKYRHSSRLTYVSCIIEHIVDDSVCKKTTSVTQGSNKRSWSLENL